MSSRRRAAVVAGARRLTQTLMLLLFLLLVALACFRTGEGLRPWLKLFFLLDPLLLATTWLSAHARRRCFCGR